MPMDVSCGLFSSGPGERFRSAVQTFREPRTTHRQVAVWLVAAMVFGSAVFEFVLYLLGACSGYSGLSAFEWSFAAQQLDFWSIDPRTCE